MMILVLMLVLVKIMLLWLVRRRKCAGSLGNRAIGAGRTALVTANVTAFALGAAIAGFAVGAARLDSGGG